MKKKLAVIALAGMMAAGFTTGNVQACLLYTSTEAVMTEVLMMEAPMMETMMTEITTTVTMMVW